MTHDTHPDLEILASYTAGELEGGEERAIAEHVESCRRCRLDVRRLARFATIDRDGELAAEAGWERVDARLARPVHGVIDAHDRFRSVRCLFWLVPAAVAALLIFSALPLGDKFARDTSLPSTILRGDHDVETGIAAIVPVGDVTPAPTHFIWTPPDCCDTYALEVSTPDLDVLWTRSGLTSPHFELPDSLASLFTPGEIYIWTVTGRVGVENVAVSEPAWFRIVESD